MNNHQKGFLLTALGVLVIAPDALLLRLISLPTEQVVLWRGLLNVLGFLLIVVLRYKGAWWQAYLNCGRVGVGCALLLV